MMGYTLECEMAKQTKVCSFFSVSDGLEPHPPISHTHHSPFKNFRENTVDIYSTQLFSSLYDGIYIISRSFSGSTQHCWDVDYPVPRWDLQSGSFEGPHVLPTPWYQWTSSRWNPRTSPSIDCCIPFSSKTLYQCNHCNNYYCCCCFSAILLSLLILLSSLLWKSGALLI